MIIRAIKINAMEFLYCVWAFNKNFERKNQNFASVSDDSLEKKDCEIDYASYYRTYTFDYLIKKVLEYSLDDYVSRIRAICDWRLKSSENFLLAMLINRQDVIACDFAYFFLSDANVQLFKFALRNQNEIFLKFALNQAIFGNNEFNQKEIKQELMSMLKLKSKTEFVLNVCLFADLSQWPQQGELKDFIEAINEIPEVKLHEQNRIVLCYNPILAICLACEQLAKIGERVAIFKHECDTLVEDLQRLGGKIVENLEEKNIHAVYLDRDFKNRTVLNLISTYRYVPLMLDDKITILLDQLWEGKLTFECDGRTSYYSKLTFLVNLQIMKLPGKKVSFFDLLGRNFKPQIETESFSQQYKFRKSSISLIFYKQFFFVVIALIIFQVINYKYTSLFNYQNFKQDDGFGGQTLIYTLDQKSLDLSKSQEDGIQQNLINFKTFTRVGLITSYACLTSVVGQILFNSFAKSKIPFDKWSIFDALNAVINAAVYTLFEKIEYKHIINIRLKFLLNMAQLLAITVSWVRFGMYLLVIQSVSKVLMTLFAMLETMGPFLLLWFQYILLMTPICQNLFQPYTATMQNLFAIIRNIIDADVGFYGYYMLQGPTLYIYKIFIELNVILEAAFLVNYFVAIISTVYEERGEQGDFAFMQNKYMYIERYMVAQEDQWGYSELFVHPPLINYLTVMLWPAMFKQSMMKSVSETFSKMIFWIENIVYYLAGFLLYEIILVPIIYFRLIVNIIRVEKIYIAIYLVFAWLFVGPFYLMHGVCFDMFNYIKILCDYKEEGDEKVIKAEEDDMQDKVVIFNEIIDTLRAIMNIFRYYIEENGIKYKKNSNKSGSPRKTKVLEEFCIKKQQVDNVTALKKASNKFDLLEEIQRQNDEDDDDQGFTLDKQMILKAWRRFRPVNKQEKKQGYEEKNKKKPTGQNLPRTKQEDIEQILGSLFTKTLLSNIHLRLYNYQELEYQVKQRMNFKQDFITLMMEKPEGLEKQRANQEEIQITERASEAQEAEETIVSEFLQNFIFDTNNKRQDQLNLNLTLKAIPARVDEHNYFRMPLFAFKIIQNSLIAFQNSEKDELFDFYDNRNKTRLRKLRTKAQATADLVVKLDQLTKTVLSSLSRIQDLGNLRGINQKEQQKIIQIPTQDEVRALMMKGMQEKFIQVLK